MRFVIIVTSLLPMRNSRELSSDTNDPWFKRWLLTTTSLLKMETSIDGKTKMPKIAKVGIKEYHRCLIYFSKIIIKWIELKSLKSQ